MNIDSAVVESCVVIRPQDGSIDYSVSDDFKQAVNEIMQKNNGMRFLMDLSKVTFMDSTAIGALVTINKWAKKQGKGLALCDLHPHVDKVLRVVTLGTIFEVYATQPKALEAICR